MAVACKIKQKIIFAGNSHFRLIGQKELVKTAITLENSMCIAVLSCLKQDIPWTKRVGKICGNS